MSSNGQGQNSPSELGTAMSALTHNVNRLAIAQNNQNSLQRVICMVKLIVFLYLQKIVRVQAKSICKKNSERGEERMNPGIIGVS